MQSASFTSVHTACIKARSLQLVGSLIKVGIRVEEDRVALGTEFWCSAKRTIMTVRHDICRCSITMYTVITCTGSVWLAGIYSQQLCATRCQHLKEKLHYQVLLFVSYLVHICKLLATLKIPHRGQLVYAYASCCMPVSLQVYSTYTWATGFVKGEHLLLEAYVSE